MSDLIEFLTARLDEDEAVAKAAIELAPLPWQRSYGEDGDARWLDILGGEGTSVVETESGANGPSLDVAEHIARHDPARVLREVEAGRRILARHRPNPQWADIVALADACMGCGVTGPYDDPNTEHMDQCPELRDLASAYAGHGDYRADWAI